MIVNESKNNYSIPGVKNYDFVCDINLKSAQCYVEVIFLASQIYLFARKYNNENKKMDENSNSKNKQVNEKK